jgi:hypothetical protein
MSEAGTTAYQSPSLPLHLHLPSPSPKSALKRGKTVAEEAERRSDFVEGEAKRTKAKSQTEEAQVTLGLNWGIRGQSWIDEIASD